MKKAVYFFFLIGLAISVLESKSDGQIEFNITHIETTAVTDKWELDSEYEHAPKTSLFPPGAVTSYQAEYFMVIGHGLNMFGVPYEIWAKVGERSITWYPTGWDFVNGTMILWPCPNNILYYNLRADTLTATCTTAAIGMPHHANGEYKFRVDYWKYVQTGSPTTSGWHQMGSVHKTVQAPRESGGGGGGGDGNTQGDGN